MGLRATVYATIAVATMLGTVAHADINQQVTKITRGQARVVKTFSGPGHLIGLVLAAHGNNFVAFMTQDHRALILGPVFDEGGANATLLAMRRFGITPPGAASLDQFAAAAMQARGIDEGTAGPRITVFVDPNCIYCHMLYDQLAPRIAAGQVRVHWVMVGFLKPSSRTKAVGIMAAGSPVSALRQNERDFDQNQESGGFQPSGDAPDLQKRIVAANTDLLRSSGTLATPTVVYMDRSGHAQVVPGVPSDLGALLRSAK